MVPTPESALTWFAVVEKGGLLLVFVVLAIGQAWAYYKRWVVPGWLLTERDARIAALEVEVHTWRTLALNTTGLASRFAVAALDPPPQPTGEG